MAHWGNHFTTGSIRICSTELVQDALIEADYDEFVNSENSDLPFVNSETRTRNNGSIIVDELDDESLMVYLGWSEWTLKDHRKFRFSPKSTSHEIILTSKLFNPWMKLDRKAILEGLNYWQKLRR